MKLDVPGRILIVKRPGGDRFLLAQVFHETAGRQGFPRFDRLFQAFEFFIEAARRAATLPESPSTGRKTSSRMRRIGSASPGSSGETSRTEAEAVLNHLVYFFLAQAP